MAQQWSQLLPSEVGSSLEFLANLTLFQLAPLETQITVSFPLHYPEYDNPLHYQGLLGNNKNIPVMMESFSIPYRYDLNTPVRNPLIPLSVDPNSPNFPHLPPEDLQLLQMHHFLELFMFLRGLAIHYFPELALALQEDEIKPEYLRVAKHVIPKHLLEVILDRVAYIYDSYSQMVGPTTRVIGYIFAALFSYSGGNAAGAHAHLRKLLEVVYEPGYGEFLMVSPPYYIPTYIPIGCAMLLELKDKVAFEQMYLILCHYAKNEYAGSISARQAIDILAAETWSKSAMAIGHSNLSSQASVSNANANVVAASSSSSLVFPPTQLGARSGTANSPMTLSSSSSSSSSHSSPISPPQPPQSPQQATPNPLTSNPNSNSNPHHRPSSFTESEQEQDDGIPSNSPPSLAPIFSAASNPSASFPSSSSSSSSSPSLSSSAAAASAFKGKEKEREKERERERERESNDSDHSSSEVSLEYSEYEETLLDKMFQSMGSNEEKSLNSRNFIGMFGISWEN